ncbi:MAG: hypothetical protein EOM70_08100 [Clostridia bacterium]|nr:hypothetical protein [Clostridia bacterium]
MERFQDLTHEQKQDYGLLLILMGFLGITPLFDAGLDHDVMYWLVLLAAPILLILTFRNKPSWTISWKDPGLYLVLLTIWAGVSFFWSIHQLRTMIEVIQLFSFVIAFFIMRNLDDDFKAKALRIGTITAVALALFGILQFIFIKSGRVEATFPHPNPFGTYLAMFSLFSMGVQVRETKVVRFGAIVVMLTAIVLSGSKGTYLAVLAAAPLIYVGLPRRSLKKPLLQTLYLTFATGIFVGIIFLITPLIQSAVPAGTNLFEKVARVGALEGSTTDRIEFWRVSLELLKNRPLTGYGYGSFFASHYIEYQVNETYTRFAHNHYLQLAAELGLPGIGLFITFLVASLRLTIKHLKNRSQALMFSGAFAACVVFLLHVLIEFSWSFPAVPIVFFAMAGLVVGKQEKCEVSDQQPQKNQPVRLTSGFLAVGLVVAFLLTSWQVYSNLLNVKGLNASNEGQLDEGLYYFELAHRIYPFSSPNRRLASENYLKLYQISKNPEDLNQAIRLANQAVTLVPFNGIDHGYLAGLYVSSQNADLAEQHYLAATRYNAYDLLSFIDFAAFYLRESREDDAIRVLMDGSNRVNRAIGSFSDPNERLAAYQQGIVIDSVLAKIFTKRGEDELADQLQQQAMKLKDQFEVERLEYAKIQTDTEF